MRVDSAARDRRVRSLRTCGLASVLWLAAASCGGSNSVDTSRLTPTTPTAAPLPLTPTCGLGPVLLFAPAGRSVAPSCPRARPAGARTLVFVSTCGFAQGEVGCTPAGVPLCPETSSARLQYEVGSAVAACVARVDVQVEPGADGGARLVWRSQETTGPRADACTPVGDPRTGEIELQQACCERTFDIDLPVSGRKFRVILRTDWSS